MNMRLTIRRLASAPFPRGTRTRHALLAGVAALIATSFGVVAQNDEPTSDPDGIIARTLQGPSSYSHLRVQPDGSFGLADLFDASGNPNYDPDFIEAIAAKDLSNATLLGQLCSYYYRQHNFTKAAKWAAPAAATGDVLGSTILGVLALDGLGGVPRDPGRALTLFQSAAEKGYTFAMVQLADCYLYGKGVAAEPKQAIKILKVAGNRGYVDAMRRLSKIYFDPDREFGTRNFVAFYWWTRKALKIELAAENSFIYIQVVEIVVALILLTAVFFVTRYVRRLFTRFRAVVKIFKVFEPRPSQEPIEQCKQQQEQQLVVVCPQCAQKLRASARRVRSQLRCPQCRTEFTMR